MRRTNDKAFTLIELLVVIGIIALIAAIAFPVFFWARAKAQQSVCASNLHQLGLASLIYAQDYDGYFPLYINVHSGQLCYESGRPQIGLAWVCNPALLHDVLTPYIKNNEVWFCPSDQFAGRDVNVWEINHLYSSYGFNFGKGSLMNDATGLWGGTAFGFIPPSKSPICEDGNLNNVQSDELEGWPVDGDDHFGGDNTFYMDGHVKWHPMIWAHAP